MLTEADLRAMEARWEAVFRARDDLPRATTEIRRLQSLLRDVAEQVELPADLERDVTAAISD